MSTSYSPASSIVSYRGGYVHTPPLLCQSCLPISLWATLWRNSPNTLPICGVITYLSDPYSITDCTTVKDIWPKIWASATSLTRTLVSHSHFRLVFRRFLTTDGQSLSVAVRIRPRYLKEVTWERGIPYAVKSVSSPVLASSSVRRF